MTTIQPNEKPEKHIQSRCNKNVYVPLQVGFVAFHCPAKQKTVRAPTKVKFALHM